MTDYKFQTLQRHIEPDEIHAIPDQDREMIRYECDHRYSRFTNTNQFVATQEEIDSCIKVMSEFLAKNPHLHPDYKKADFDLDPKVDFTVG